jgi:hypothetical protein
MQQLPQKPCCIVYSVCTSTGYVPLLQMSPSLAAAAVCQQRALQLAKVATAVALNHAWVTSTMQMTPGSVACSKVLPGRSAGH